MSYNAGVCVTELIYMNSKMIKWKKMITSFDKLSTDLDIV